MFMTSSECQTNEIVIKEKNDEVQKEYKEQYSQTLKFR
jgi:hypothetical protein